MNFIKVSSYKEIPNVIREVYYNKVNIRPDISSLIINELRMERKTRVLTAAEREVYRLKEEGLTRGQIAEKLF